MSLILDFGDKRQGFLFKNSCYIQKLHNESETLQKIAFLDQIWKKMKKMVTNQDNKFFWAYISILSSCMKFEANPRSNEEVTVIFR